MSQSMIFETSLPVIWKKYNDPDIDLSDDSSLGYHFKLCRMTDKETIQILLQDLLKFKQTCEVDLLLFSYFHSFYMGLLSQY